MKKIIGLLIVLSIFGVSSLCACPHTQDGSDCIACQTEKEAKNAKKLYDDAATFGEAAGVISAYATHSDSFNEFADNVANHEFESSALNWAQETGKEIGDAVAGFYIWATED